MKARVQLRRRKVMLNMYVYGWMIDSLDECWVGGNNVCSVIRFCL